METLSRRLPLSTDNDNDADNLETGIARRYEKQTTDMIAAPAVESTNEDFTHRSLRKNTGGLRLRNLPPIEPAEELPKVRRLMVDGKTFPKRRKKQQHDVHKMEPTSIQKLIRGIWDQIYSHLSFDMKYVVRIVVLSQNFKLSHI